jgi:8-oxo-dGTP diphosphatase
MLRAAARSGDPLDGERLIRPPLQVVAAALVRNARVLAARRLAPSGWEFPGGKIEAGESAAHALERECHEELGVIVRCGPHLATASRDQIVVHLWRAELIEGCPAPLTDHSELRWVSRTELDELDWLPIDRDLLDAVRAVLG